MTIINDNMTIIIYSLLISEVLKYGLYMLFLPCICLMSHIVVKIYHRLVREHSISYWTVLFLPLLTTPCLVFC